MSEVAENMARQGRAGLSSFRRIALSASVLASLLLAAVAAYYRPPWSDEGWFSSAAYNLARHGFLGTTVLDPRGMHLTRIAQRTYWVMPLYLLGQAFWLKLFAATLFAVRSFTLLWIPVALFSFYRLMRRITQDPPVSALATCLAALNFIFLDNASFARPDLMCCALGLTGLAAYAEWRGEHFYRALMVSNTFISASGLTHPNGLFHWLGLIVLVLYYDRRRLNARALGAAALPYAVAAAGWAVYAFQDFPAFVDQMRANGMNGRWAATLNPAIIFWDEIRLRYLPAYGFATRGWAVMKLVSLAAYVAAIAGALFQPGFRQQPSTRLMLMLLAVYFAGLSLFNQKLAYYLIHIIPWYVALTALYAGWLWRHSRTPRAAVAMILIALVAVETGGILLRAHSRAQIVAEEQAAIDFARAHARAGDRIVGTAAFIYGFAFDPRLRDDAYLGIASGQAPDVVIIDPIYRDLYAGWKNQRADDMRKIDARLAGYKLAFDNGACQVYLRPAR
jgi:hypothetical protein